MVDAQRIVGRVTSVGFSPVLGHTIGLAVVEGEGLHATQFNIRIGGGQLVRAHRAETPFYDPTGARLLEVTP